MTSRHTLVLVLALALAACGKGPSASQKGATAATTPPLLLSAEDVHTVANTALTSGPVITGSVQPEQRADLRAEVSAVVLQVLQGKRRSRCAAATCSCASTTPPSATASPPRKRRAAAAAQAFEQAERQFQRMKTLRDSGMASAQQLEDAEVRRNNAQSELEAAKTRVVLARQQLQRTEVRAPFDGVVSDRKVSAGDTAQVGKELREGDRPGQHALRGPGFRRPHRRGEGRAERGLPRERLRRRRVHRQGEARESRRQRRPRARSRCSWTSPGRSSRDSRACTPRAGSRPSRPRASRLPATALVRDGDKASAWRVRDGKLQKVMLALGERDPRTGDFVLKGGLAEGDQVIRHPSTLLKEGQVVQAAAPAAPTKAAASGSAPATTPN